MHFLEPPSLSNSNRSPSQTNFIIEEDSRSDISDFPGSNGHESNSSPRDCFTHGPRMKVVVTALSALGFCLLILSSTFGFLYFRTIPSFHTCKTKQCTRTATLLIKTMDETVDPCEDFHKFACGNWISDTAAVVSVAVYDHTTIMRDRIVGRLRSLTENITNEDSEALQQVRTLYNTCVDLVAIEDAGLQPMVELVQRLVTAHNDSIAKTLARIHRETGQDYIFDLSIEPSFRNTSVHLLNIGQPELPVVKANFLYSPDVIEAYKRLIRKVLTRLSSEKGFPQFVNVTETAARISDFERLFALAMTDEEEHGKAATANLMTLKELNFKQFNWTEYVETLFDGVADVEINDDFTLNINDLEYLNNLVKILSKTNPDHLKEYILWEVLYTFGKDATKEIRDLFNAFSAIAQGTESTPNRHTECVLLLDQSLPFALTHKYVIKYVKDSTILEAQEMFRNILRAFKAQVRGLDWMDIYTKTKALEKANMVEGYIGFPRWLKNSSAVDEYHKGLRFTNNSFFKNVLIMMKWISEKQLREYVEQVDRSWTYDSPAEADAFYDDERNAITFPSGFLQEPFIGMGLKAIDYGALGSVLGHELTHGFDTMGRYSDGYGRLSSWWTLNTLQHFIMKARCFEDQYSAYWLPELSPVPGPNNTVSGKRTLAENIADNGGIREAFQAYKYYIDRRGPEPRLPGLEKYTPEQLFFLSFAQSWCSYLSPAALTDMVETNVHSPPKFRIQGPLANFEEFSRVWECSPQSRMNPPKKCVLWG